NGYATYWTNGTPVSNSNFNDIQNMQESIGHRFKLETQYDNRDVVLNSNGSINWDKINTAFGALGFANGLNTELLEHVVKTGSSQSGGRAELQTLGKTGTRYLHAAKGFSRGIFAVTIANSGVQTWNAWAGSDMDVFSNQNNKWGVTCRAMLDIGMGYAAFLGPTGFGITDSYFILDAVGVFDR